MYAPKYRSWMTDDERRESAINYKASLYIAEIREMADKARAEFAEPLTPVEEKPGMSQFELMQLYSGFRNAAQQNMAYLNGANLYNQGLGAALYNPFGFGGLWR